jgi:hypothetical protein
VRKVCCNYHHFPEKILQSIFQHFPQVVPALGCNCPGREVIAELENILKLENIKESGKNFRHEKGVNDRKVKRVEI